MSLIEQKTTVPPGTMAVVVGGDLARYHAFTLAMTRLRLPRGSNLVWARNLSISMALNDAIETMPPDHDWLWLMGDDHFFPDDMLFRLLQRMYEWDCKIVAPMCFKHSAPFEWVMYRAGDDGTLAAYRSDEVPQHGLFRVDACGSAGMLVRREVLDEMGSPWFKQTNEFVPNEDIVFCQRAKELGYDIWVDLDQPLGHVGTKVVTPFFNENGGGWGITIDLGHGHLVWSDKVNEKSV